MKQELPGICRLLFFLLLPFHLLPWNSDHEVTLTETLLPLLHRPLPHERHRVELPSVVPGLAETSLLKPLRAGGGRSAPSLPRFTCSLPKAWVSFVHQRTPILGPWVEPEALVELASQAGQPRSSFCFPAPVAWQPKPWRSPLAHFHERWARGGQHQFPSTRCTLNMPIPICISLLPIPVSIYAGRRRIWQTPFLIVS